MEKKFTLLVKLWLAVGFASVGFLIAGIETAFCVMVVAVAVPIVAVLVLAAGCEMDQD